ncbi:MAG TPA: iron ABC transporter permease [Rhodanobacter sp.]
MNSIALPRSSGVRARRPIALGGLVLLLALAALWSLSQGAMNLSAAEVLGSIGRWSSGHPLTGDDRVVLMLRLPRVLMAMLVGASLACGGAAMQGLFRNPLADPGLIGVSAGSALGAVVMIVLGGVLFGGASGLAGSLGVAMAAFVGGLVATALVYLMGRRRPGVATLLLAGVAVSAIAMAGIGLLTFMANENQLRDLTFWSLGSLGGSDWQRLGIVTLPMLLPLLWLPRTARALNALLLGEHEARLLGFRPERVQPLLIALVALMVSAAVSMTGVIGFIGLLVPHLLRLVWGPDHRMLLPASALGGAALLVAADTLARTLVAPAELPIGVLTALIGGPFFLWLLLRSRIGEVRT